MSDSEDNVIEIDNEENGTSVEENNNESPPKEPKEKPILETSEDSAGFYCTWKSPGNECWSVDCEPCCGSPCNGGDGLRCFLCFMCCYLCIGSYHYSQQLNQDCAIVNHFCLFPLCLACYRRNSRVEFGIGNTDEGFIGDYVMANFCCLCSLGQQLRMEPDPEKYLGWYKEISGKPIKLIDDEMKFYIK
eukprot:TRINITY_DN268_c0_g2_i2.p1 TRINITY_DN268_c0_g2~~TRINITY_DN268_c0_g2_i2.p1  ORF type:complete len:189 (+),score=46.47 TRINITY_DN268_c0_g2_i2:76-642(+)